MDVGKWLRSNVNYGRRLVDSGIVGASQGRQKFLQGEPLTPFLNEAARDALKLAAVGACLGLLGSAMGRKGRPTGRELAFCVLGGMLGFGASLTWRTRPLTRSMARGALKRMYAVHDARWLERHPVDYA
jgi:hypothetical protein